jgi:hypothetical protein
MKRHIFFYGWILFISGCVNFTAMGPGEFSSSGLVVTTDITWNQAPAEATRLSRPDSRTWTQDGFLLDRLLIIPAVSGGEPIFRQTSSSQALPVFESTMLPNEIQELVESSIVKLFGEGGAAVETRGLRPQSYGADNGIMFDLEVSLSDGPDYKGLTGALVVDGKLYLILYLAAEPYYYDKHVERATSVIKSARVSRPL